MQIDRLPPRLVMNLAHKVGCENCGRTICGKTPGGHSHCGRRECIYELRIVDHSEAFPGISTLEIEKILQEESE